MTLTRKAHEELAQLSVWLPKDLMARLREHAQDGKTKQRAAVTAAIEAYLDARPVEPKPAI